MCGPLGWKLLGTPVAGNAAFHGTPQGSFFVREIGARDRWGRRMFTLLDAEIVNAVVLKVYRSQDTDKRASRLAGEDERRAPVARVHRGVPPAVSAQC
jgi:hypothetical protein